MLGDTIIITHQEPIIGVRFTVDESGGWLDFARTINEIHKKYPDYNDFGHSSNHCLIFNTSLLDDLKTGHLQEIMFPHYDTSSEHNFIEEYTLGKCVTTMFRGFFNNKEPHQIDRKMKEIRDYIKRNNISVRGDIIVKAIINDFIIKDPDNHLYEILVPLK